MTNHTSETDHEVESQRTRIPLCSVLFLLVGYPLSTGPVAFLLTKFHLQGTVTKDIVLSMYYPLDWLLTTCNGGDFPEWARNWNSFWMKLAM